MNKEIEAVQWIVENQAYYDVSEAGKEGFQELVKYGSNIHTYTAEALASYRKLQDSFLNNPYFYGTTYSWHFGREKKTYTVFSNAICGYFTPVSDGTRQILVPFGLYRQWVTGDEYEDKIQQFLKKGKEELTQCEQKVNHKMTGEIQSLEKQLIALYTKEFPKDVKDKKPDLSVTEQLWKEKRKQNTLLWFAYFVIIMILWMCLHEGQQEFIRACIPLGLVLAWKQWKEFLIKRQRNKMRKDRQLLLTYKAQYEQCCGECMKKISSLRMDEMETAGKIISVDMRKIENELYQYLHQEKKPQEKTRFGMARWRIFLLLAVAAAGYAVYVWYQWYSLYLSK